MRFEKWVGTLLNQNQQEIRRLLDDSADQEFLIAWALFESKCFHGRIVPFSSEISEQRSISTAHAPPVVQRDGCCQRIFFLAIVAYRFRNNMFHGNKGVQSWLLYTKQIAPSGRDDPVEV